MREFNKVSPLIWGSGRFLRLKDDSARLCIFYLMTCRHVTSIGCFELPAAYACSDLGWTLAAYNAATAALVAADMIALDLETQEVMIARWLKHNPPTNPKHAEGARRLTDKIASGDLRARVRADLELWGQRWMAESHNGRGRGSQATVQESEF